jgi:tetratricopeptide (TPR) repeat protein
VNRLATLMHVRSGVNAFGAVALLFSLLLPLSCSSPTPRTTEHVSLYARDQLVAGLVALHKREYASAEAAARAAMEDAPKLMEAHLLLVEALLKQGREEDGRAALNELAALAPHRPEPHLLMGMLTERSGDLPAAADLYQRARDTYDTGRLQRDQMVDYVAACFLARGRLSGFEAVRLVQERFGKDATTTQLHEQISRDNRDWFLNRVMPDVDAAQAK